MKREVANISHFMAQSRRTSAAAAAAGPIKPRFKPRFGSPPSSSTAFTMATPIGKERKEEAKTSFASLPPLSFCSQEPTLFYPILFNMARSMHETFTIGRCQRREEKEETGERWLHSSFMTMPEMRVPYVDESKLFASHFLSLLENILFSSLSQSLPKLWHKYRSVHS